MRETGALCSAILRVVHPELYIAGREALVWAATLPAVSAALDTWPSVFAKLQIISNRQTPFHRDLSGEATWFELLISLGSYDRATMVLRNLGIEVAYTPGSAVALSSYLVHHGVSAVEPDRICYAWFMSRHLHDNHGLDNVEWMAEGVYGPTEPAGVTGSNV